MTKLDAILIAESVSMLGRAERREVVVARAIRTIEDRCGGRAIPDDWLPEIVRAVEIGFPAELPTLPAGRWYR